MKMEAVYSVYKPFYIWGDYGFRMEELFYYSSLKSFNNENNTLKLLFIVWLTIPVY